MVDGPGSGDTRHSHPDAVDDGGPVYEHTGQTPGYVGWRTNAVTGLYRNNRGAVAGRSNRGRDRGRGGGRSRGRGPIFRSNNGRGYGTTHYSGNDMNDSQQPIASSNAVPSTTPAHWNGQDQHIQRSSTSQRPSTNDENADNFGDPYQTFHQIHRTPRDEKGKPTGPFRKRTEPFGQMGSDQPSTARNANVSRNPTNLIIQSAKQYSKAATMYLYLHNVPAEYGTREIEQFFRGHLNISRIQLYEADFGKRKVQILVNPLPANVSQLEWLKSNMYMPDSRGEQVLITSHWDIREPQSEDKLQSRPPRRIMIDLEKVEFGIKLKGLHVQILASSILDHLGLSGISMDLQRAELQITFAMQQPNADRLALGYPDLWRFRINFAQLKQVYLLTQTDGSSSLVLSLQHPPMVFRKKHDSTDTHEKGEDIWEEGWTWFRQTDMGADKAPRPVQLKPAPDAAIDLGRWLTYRIFIGKTVPQSSYFRTMLAALGEHNIKIIKCTADKFHFETRQANDLWSWWDPSHTAVNLHDMISEVVDLPFAVQYQLEVCLTTGVLCEAEMTQDFLRNLSKEPTYRAVATLEKAVDSGYRLHDPSALFTLGMSKASKKSSKLLIRIAAAIVTPTTVYFSTPVLETSNRVVRNYIQFQDRFLRVKFTDERYKGRLWTNGETILNRVFERIEYTMTHGIQIGDRHYEFLAFGNSQLREHGAYFFASTSTMSVARIRREMGDFADIKVVAKYASRMGQCFSTTRSIGQTLSIEAIADIEGGDDGGGKTYCFTDGVGKISPFLAKWIGLQYTNDTRNTPSVFQFRLAGYKGILTVDPSLKHRIIQLRSSQQKFAAELHGGLEICRVSRFASAYLNQQLILILSTLGVSDAVFIIKQDLEISRVNEAMLIPQTAYTLLQRRVDFNQATLTMAEMIKDGFMKTKDPFMMTCLHLWRSWYLKTLKEKAHLYIDQGAFVLGTTDETGTLQGHFDYHPNRGNSLPEIFIQVPNPEAKGEYKVIKQLCLLARNPSLHPGDIRVVQAVDVPALRYLKDCVVFPQNGDRDLASMCAGGDLDGDDYIVIWDPEMIPAERNHPPMDYSAPRPLEVEEEITATHLIKFFVDHIKNDNLPRIATSHRYTADHQDKGVKDAKCLRLAMLHSRAVDYAKTGIPAILPRHLIATRKPHWSEPHNKNQMYNSRKVLGKLYDRVTKVSFQGIWDSPFDDRVLRSCNPDQKMCDAAVEIKQEYDDAVRRIMGQFGIESEFEVFTTFVLQHDSTIGDYKFHETIGEMSQNLCKEYREICYEKAGTTNEEREWTKLKPFIVAMYSVTARQVSNAAIEAEQIYEVASGQDVPLRPMTFATMPMMSFPWIFWRELGHIANRRDIQEQSEVDPMKAKDASRKSDSKQKVDMLSEEGGSESVDIVEVKTSTGKGVYREGDILKLVHDRPKHAAARKVPQLPPRVIEEVEENVEEAHTSPAEEETMDTVYVPKLSLMDQAMSFFDQAVDKPVADDPKSGEDHQGAETEKPASMGYDVLHTAAANSGVDLLGPIASEECEVTEHKQAEPVEQDEAKLVGQAEVKVADQTGVESAKQEAVNSVEQKEVESVEQKEAKPAEQAGSSDHA